RGRTRAGSPRSCRWWTRRPRSGRIPASWSSSPASWRRPPPRRCGHGPTSWTSPTTASSCATSTIGSPFGIAARRPCTAGPRPRRSGRTRTTCCRRAFRPRWPPSPPRYSAAAAGRGEVRSTRRDGTPVVVASRWARQVDAQGQPSAVLETSNDITERKRAEEALHHAQAELAYLARVATLGELSASIVHEINQPLGAVVNNASACVRWLAAQNLEEARQSALRVVADGHRAADI